jgi:DNA mismatch repair protein MutH
MERAKAIEEIRKLIGQDLIPLARKYGVTVWKKDKETGKLTKNKGWAGHTLERYLGLPLNSSQSPNFGSWELKQTSLKKIKGDKIVVKETMQITMIDPIEVQDKGFEDSHLKRKIEKALVAAVMYTKGEDKAILYSVAEFDLDVAEIREQIKADYEEVRNMIKTKGFDYLSGKMGVLVQPRTKGPGKVKKKSRAFYARTRLVAHILNISPLSLPIEVVAKADKGQKKKKK